MSAHGFGIASDGCEHAPSIVQIDCDHPIGDRHEIVQHEWP
jgi:hypothetical protein